MEVHDWSCLPPEVLVQIFRHIPSSDLVLNIPLVCRAWRDTKHHMIPEVLIQIFHHIPSWYLVVNIPLVCRAWRDTQRHMLQQIPFWWKRLEEDGIEFTREHREDLINNVDKRKLVKLLKAILLPDISFTKELLSFEDNEMLSSKFWDITSKLVSLASVYLMFMFRNPISVTIILEPEHGLPLIEDLDLLLLQLSHTNCEVSFQDMDSCMFKSSLSADSILRYMNRDNVKCNMKQFCGYVTSINSLPSSIQNLSLAIECDEYGKAIDPGISMLQERLPNLYYVGLDVRSGTDLSNIQLLPYYNIDTIND